MTFYKAVPTWNKIQYFKNDLLKIIFIPIAIGIKSTDLQIDFCGGKRIRTDDFLRARQAL